MPLDKYANIATIDLTMSGANALTFQALQTNLGIEPDRTSANAMIIDEIDYFVKPVQFGQMTTASDVLLMGITISNTLGALDSFSDRRIMHTMQFSRQDFGTAASAQFVKQPFVFQFFPPLVTAERVLYLGMDTTGLGVASECSVRIYYRIVKISQADFIELAEVFRLVG
jgi:hypothetical protein